MKRARQTLVLQPRDVELLKALFACRYLTTSQIQQVFFGRNRSVVCARLNQKLLPHGFVSRHVQDAAFHTTDAVYALGRAGIRVLAQELQVAPHAVGRGLERSAESFFLRHLLAVNDLWAALRYATRDPTAPCSVASWWTEKKLRGLHRVAHRHAPIADSRFVLAYLDDARAHFFVEVDRGTESLRVFQDKVRRYLAYFVEGGHERDYGTSAFRVLTVVPDERRLTRLLAASAEAGANDIFLFATTGGITQHGILGSVWCTPRDRYAQDAGMDGQIVVTERADACDRRYSIAE